MKLPWNNKLSLKWKIFGACLWLSFLIVAFNVIYSIHVIRMSSTPANAELKAAYQRYSAFQRSHSAGMTAAVDLWATSLRLQEALKASSDNNLSGILEDAQHIFAKNIRPDFIMLVDQRGEVVRTPNCPFDEPATRTMRVFADLRQGMSLDNVLVEHEKRTWLVAGTPVKIGNQQVGSVLIGVALYKLLADFQRQSNGDGDEDMSKMVTLSLVHNQDVTASAARADLWDDIARATRREAQETIDEGGERSAVMSMNKTRHDLYYVQINGYDGPATGSLGMMYVTRSRADRESRINGLIRDNIILSGVAFAIAMIVAFILSLLMTRPIKAFIEATSDLAHGQGDLTRRLNTDGTAREMAVLGGNLNSMFANLHKLASEVQAAAFQVGASSAEISAASKQMLSGANDQAARIESSTAAVTELSSSIQQVAENALEATKVAQAETNNMTGGIQQIAVLNSLVGETASKVQALGHSSRRIAGIVEVIRQISEQTSLLALNASIEAAHAGEQGRGFAVVADEVSSLAKRVGQSAKDIEALIGTITEQTTEAVSSMQNVTASFGELTRGVSGTQSALKQIVDVVQDTARSVQEQAVVSDEIARNMDAVQKVTQEVLGASKEAVVQGDQLHSLALSLDELVRGFRIDESAPPPSHSKTDGLKALPSSATGDRRKVARG